MYYYQDEDNYYKVDLDAQRSFSKLSVKKAGVETELGHLSGPGYTRHFAFQLEVSIVDGVITVLRDGVDLFANVAASTLSSGSVALYSWGNNGANFDDITVTQSTTSSNANVEPAVEAEHFIFTDPPYDSNTGTPVQLLVEQTLATQPTHEHADPTPETQSFDLSPAESDIFFSHSVQYRATLQPIALLRTK